MYSSSCSLRGLRGVAAFGFGPTFRGRLRRCVLGHILSPSFDAPPLRRPGAGLVALTNRESLIRIEGDPPRITHGRYHAQSGTASSIALECLLVCHPAPAPC